MNKFKMIMLASSKKALERGLEPKECKMLYEVDKVAVKREINGSLTDIMFGILSFVEVLANKYEVKASDVLEELKNLNDIREHGDKILDSIFGKEE